MLACFTRHAQHIDAAGSRYQTRLSNKFLCQPTRTLRQSTAEDLLSKFPVSNAYRAHSAYHYFTNKRTSRDMIVDYKLYEARMKNTRFGVRLFIV